MDISIKDQIMALVGQAKLLQREEIPGDVEEYLDDIERKIGIYFPIKILETFVQRYKDRLDKILKNKLPDIMIDLGVEDLTLDSGEKIELMKVLSPKVVDEDTCKRWLCEIGREEVLKTTLEFGAGEVDTSLTEHLEECGYSYKEKTFVHPQTLKKIVTDRYKGGEGLPPSEAISVSPFDMVKIKTK